jgi:hypothetical protein
VYNRYGPELEEVDLRMIFCDPLGSQFQSIVMAKDVASSPLASCVRLGRTKELLEALARDDLPD